MSNSTKKQTNQVKSLSIVIGVAILVLGSLLLWRVALQETGEVQSLSTIDAEDFNGSYGSSNRIGTDVVSLGDLNGDGTNDYAVAADKMIDGTSRSKGEIRIQLMNANGTVASTQRIGEGVGGFTGTIADSSYDELTGPKVFGEIMDVIGDLDGDGNNEIIVGESDYNNYEGRAVLLFLNDNGTVKNQVDYTLNSFENWVYNRPRIGSSVAGIGDLDGDGVPDMAIGAYFDTAEGGGVGNYTGKVHIIFLNSDGTSKSQAVIQDGTENFSTLAAFDNISQAGLAGMGDIDGDSVPDLAIAGGQAKSVYTVLLNSDGSVKSSVETPYNFLNLGTSAIGDLSNIGDLNGDGINELLMSPRGLGSRSSIMFLNSDATRSSVSILGYAPLGISGSHSVSTGFIGDTDSDGKQEIIFGVSTDTDKGIDSGAFFVAEVTSAGAVESYTKYVDETVTAPTEIVLGKTTRFGSTVESLGDLDGDGVGDLLVTATGGKLFVLFLNSNGTLKSYTNILSSDVGAVSTNFGMSLALLGNLDGDDSTVEIAAGRTNQVFIFSISSDGTVNESFDIVTIDASNGMVGGGGVTVESGFGSMVSSAGDINGDGIVDLLVGAASAAYGQSRTGSFSVMLLNSSGLVTSQQIISNGVGGFSGTMGRNAYFGTSGTSLGDINGDGVPDIAVGASGYRGTLGNITSGGAVVVMLMNSNGTVASDYIISTDDDEIILSNYASMGAGAMDNIGDINSDGIPDIAAGLRQSVGNPAGSNNGGMIIVTLNSDGSPNGAQIIDSTYGNLGLTINDGDLFGNGISGIGDFNGDGIFDVAVGASSTDKGAYGTAGDIGAVHLLYLDGDAFDPNPPTPGSSGTITKSGDTETTVSLSWAAASDDVSASSALTYSVYYAADGTDLSTVAAAESNGTLSQSTANITSATISGLTGETDYEFQVVVADQAGNKAAYTALGAASGDIPDLTPPTAGASGALSASTTSSQIVLSWTAAEDDETEEGSLVYKIYGGEGTGEELDLSSLEAVALLDESSLLATITGTTTYTITNLDPTTAYTYTVTVTDASANTSIYAQIELVTGSRLTEKPTYPVQTSILLNGGAACTNTRDISVVLQGNNVDRVVLSNNNRFLGSFWEFFSGSPMQRTWTLLDTEGEQSVYVVFRSWYGNKSYIHESTISYEPNNPDCTALAVEIDPTTGEETVVVEVPTTTTTTTETDTTTDPTDTDTDTTTDTDTSVDPVPDVEEEEEEVVEEDNSQDGVIPYQNPEELVDRYLAAGRVVRLDGTNNYRYVTDRNIAYNFYKDFAVKTWVAHGANYETISRDEWSKMIVDSNRYLGPLPGTSIINGSSGYSWIEAVDSNPSNIIEHKFVNRTVLQTVFGRAFRSYIVSVGKGVYRSWQPSTFTITSPDEVPGLNQIRTIVDYNDVQL